MGLVIALVKTQKVSECTRGYTFVSHVYVFWLQKNNKMPQTLNYLLLNYLQLPSNFHYNHMLVGLVQIINTISW